MWSDGRITSIIIVIGMLLIFGYLAFKNMNDNDKK